MSLLMQALKKAEQIKQKQSGGGSDEALTLSPKELSAEPEKIESVDVVEVNEFSKSAAEQTTLTLSPQMDDKPAEVVLSALELTHEVAPSVPASPPSPEIPLPENEVQHHSVIAEPVDTSKKEEKTASDNVTKPESPMILAVPSKNISARQTCLKLSRSRSRLLNKQKN